MVDLAGRILRAPECQEHYVDSEDENLGAMMLANKTENATAHTANTAERDVAQDEALKPAEMVDFVYTANTAKRNVTQMKPWSPLKWSILN
jgi:hypothetical protein